MIRSVVLLLASLAVARCSLFPSTPIWVSPRFGGGKTTSATLFELNTGRYTYVNSVDFGSLSAQVQGLTMKQDFGDAILHGSYNSTVTNGTKTAWFTVRSVFIALPSNKITAEIVNATAGTTVIENYFPFDQYLLVQPSSVASSTVSKASEVNTNLVSNFNNLVINPGIVAFSDWINDRIHRSRAVIFGSLGTNKQGVVDLTADRLFVEIPDRTHPCIAVDPVFCPEGEENTYYLNSNRCILPTNPPCHPIRSCPEYILACFPGYQLTSFRGASGCPVFYCFPDWIDTQ